MSPTAEELRPGRARRYTCHCLRQWGQRGRPRAHQAAAEGAREDTLHPAAAKHLAGPGVNSPSNCSAAAPTYTPTPAAHPRRPGAHLNVPQKGRMPKMMMMPGANRPTQHRITPAGGAGQGRSSGVAAAGMRMQQDEGQGRDSMSSGLLGCTGAGIAGHGGKQGQSGKQNRRHAPTNDRVHPRVLRNDRPKVGSKVEEGPRHGLRQGQPRVELVGGHPAVGGVGAHLQRAVGSEWAVGRQAQEAGMRRVVLLAESVHTCSQWSAGSERTAWRRGGMQRAVVGYPCAPARMPPAGTSRPLTGPKPSQTLPPARPPTPPHPPVPLAAHLLAQRVHDALLVHHVVVQHGQHHLAAPKDDGAGAVEDGKPVQLLGAVVADAARLREGGSGRAGGAAAGAREGRRVSRGRAQGGEGQGQRGRGRQRPGRQADDLISH